jgi:two-component system response regulator NreC
MERAEPLRILLADDHEVMLNGLKAILEQDGFKVVGEAPDGRTAVALCETLHPDVAVLDVAMPLLNGIDAAREIGRLRPKVKTILLTMYSEDFQVLASLKAGVNGYVAKTSGYADVKRAIEAVVKGQMYLSSSASDTLVHAYLTNGSVEADPLSRRERQVLQLIAEGNNMREIASLLGISARTAETHRTRIMTKLNLTDVAGLVKYAIRHGLIVVERRPADCGERLAAASAPLQDPGTRPSEK